MSDMGQEPITKRLRQRANRVQQAKKSRHLPLIKQLLPNLESDESSESVPQKIVWTLRLNPTNLFHIVGSHFLNSCVRLLFSVQTYCLHTINRLIGAKATNQRRVYKYVGSAGMYAKQR